MFTSTDVNNKTVCEQDEKTANKNIEIRKTDLIQAYRSEKNDLDAERETEIRGKVQWLIQKLRLIEEAVQSKLNCLEIADKSLIRKQDFIDIWIECKEIRYDAGVCIETFFEDCYGCEKQYSMKVEKLIKHHYETLRRVIKNFPKDMFEQDILNINAQFLNNIREYANFSRHVVLYQISKLIKMKLSLASKLEAWISLKVEEAERLKEALPRIVPIEEKDSIDGIGRVSQSYIQKLKQKLFLNFLCGDQGSEFTWNYFLDNTTEDWPDQLQTDTCDFVLELLIKTYSIAKEQSIEALRLLIESFDTICFENSQAERMRTSSGFGEEEKQQQQSYKTLINAEENPLDNIHDKIISWYNATCKMQTKTGKAFRFLTEFAKIWNQHLQRMKDTKSLIVAVLGKDVETQLERRKSNQAGILMAIGNLRLESSEKCMNQHMEKISKLILDTEQSCRDELNEEIVTLEKFREFAKSEGQLLGAELGMLQEKYNFEKHITYFSDTGTDHLTEAEQVEHLPKHLQLCDLHTNAMENWNCALMQEVNQYQQISERDVCFRMENWLVDESYGLLDRLDGYIHMESKQYDRIVEQVYNVRLIELRNHQMLLELHKNAVESHLSQMFKDLEHFVSIVSRTIESSTSYFAEVQLIAAEAENSTLVENLLNKIKDKRIKDEKIFDNSVIHFKEQCNQKFRYLQECQLNFIKSLKMFSGGGTYSAEEAHRFLTELAVVDKLIITKQTAFDNEVNNSHTVLTQEMNACYSHICEYLINVLNELKFAEETNLISSEAENSLNIKFCNFQKDGNRITDEFKTIILILLNELQATPSSHLLETLENFMTKSRKRALTLIPPHNRKSESTIGNKGKSRSFIKKSKSVLSTHKTIVEKSKLTDYRKLFPEYNEPYLEEMPFVSIVNNEIGNTLTSLQEKAASFYASKNLESSLLNVALPTTYDNFMIECTDLFQNYCKLCMDSCSKEIINLFQCLSKLRHAADLYVAKRLIEFHGTKIQKLKKVYNQFESERADLLEEDRCIRDNCKCKLLVLHGYPSNKSLLKDLEEEIESTCSDLERKILLFIRKGRKYLSNIKNRYFDRITAICKTLEIFQEKIFEAYIFSSLTEPLTNTVKEMNPSVLNTETFLSESMKLESDIQYLLNEGIKEGNIEFIKDCLKRRRKALLHEIECVSVDSDIKDCSHSPSTKLVFHAPVKIQEVLSSMTEHYLKEFEQYYHNMDFFQTYKSLSSEWMTEWRSSVRSAQIPYCV